MWTWNEMTEEQKTEMQDWYMANLFAKIVNNIGIGIMILPFVAVLCMPKSVGARICLLVFMTIDFVLSFIAYIVTIFVLFRQSIWWLEQVSDFTKLFGLPEDMENAATFQKNDQRFAVMSFISSRMAYGFIGGILLWVPIELLILCVFYKFYKTGRDSGSG